MKLFYLYTLLITMLMACSESTGEAAATNEEATVEKPDSSLVTSLKLPDSLDVFASVPDTIDGCGDYYYLDGTEAQKGKYIFLSNLSEFAIIRIGGKDVYLEKNKGLSMEVTPDHFISVFEGGGYKATLEAKIVDEYDEGGFYKGKLTIEAGQEKKVINVQGESGC